MNASDSQRELARQMALLGMDPKNYQICSEKGNAMHRSYLEADLNNAAAKMADPVGPPTFFMQLDTFFNRLNMLEEQIYHLHDRLIGASPEPTNGKDVAVPPGALSAYEQMIDRGLTALARMEDRLGQIQRRL